jgi:hypothetical protein
LLQDLGLLRFVFARSIRPLAISLCATALLVAGCGGGGGGSASHLSASAKSVSFGTVNVGSANSQTITVTNQDATNVNVSATASGAGFSVSGASNTALAPDQSVDLYVNFNPTAKGSVSGTLSVTSTASPTPLKITLSGKGGNGAQHSVVLNWNPSSSSVVGYFIYRSEGGSSSYAKINNSANPSTSYTDTGVTAGATYYYAVTSVNSNNVESGYSNQVSVTVPDN